MSWFSNSKPGICQKYATQILKAGPIPKHVAFIMDGNRRFALKSHLSSVNGGHVLGFEQLAKVFNKSASLTLEWCRDFGISEVTVYAFSIENFKRSEEEVTGLLELAERKFKELISDKDKIVEQGIRFRFFGDIGRFSVTLQSLIAEIELFSRNFHKAYINVCLAYTAQDEMKRAVEKIHNGVQLGLLEPSDICESLISQCLDSFSATEPDLFVRTSGEQRMSDFMLWQCSNCCLYFDSVLWPEFTFWHLFLAVLHYQRSYSAIEEIQTVLLNSKDDEKINKERVMRFVNDIDAKRIALLRDLIR